MEYQNFDVVICVAAKDNLIARTTIKLISKNIRPQNIYILTKPQYVIYYRDLLKKHQVVVVNEDEIVPNLNFNFLEKVIKKREGIPLRTGWYFQQFLKMGFARSRLAKEYYLIWDADTLPVSTLDFFKEGHPLFTRKTEFHKPYFDTMERLLNFGKVVPYSFIAEHMIVNVEIMKELIEKIEKANIIGDTWFEKIINSIKSDVEIGFSEFETYGTYATINFPNFYSTRELVTWREGASKYGRIVFKRDIEEMSDQYQIVSLEPANKPAFVRRQFQFITKIFLYSINYILDQKYLLKKNHLK